MVYSSIDEIIRVEGGRVVATLCRMTGRLELAEDAFSEAAVDDLVFLHSIKVGDLIILQSRVTCAFRTSMEVQVDVFSEEALTGQRPFSGDGAAAVVDTGPPGAPGWGACFKAAGDGRRGWRCCAMPARRWNTPTENWWSTPM